MRASHQGRVVLRVVVSALLGLACVVLASLYFFGGFDLIRFALSQVTWDVVGRVSVGIILFTSVVSTNLFFGFKDAPPPTWIRHSLWVNLIEFCPLLGLNALGVWAIPRFGRAFK